MPISFLTVLVSLTLWSAEPPASSGPAATPPSHAAAPTAPAAAAPDVDWKTAESALLIDHVQLTPRSKFVKAGEAYFDHTSPPGWVIFQAIPVPDAGKTPDPFYSMYVAKLRYESGRIAGIDEPVRVSPPGSANTCGWFIPGASAILFASTLDPPGENNQPGYQRGTGKYRWEFPREMRVVQRDVIELEPKPDASHPPLARCGTGYLVSPLVGDGTGYIAEGSLSPNGRFLVYTKMIDPLGKNLDIFIRDMRTGTEHGVVQAPGYDGGPFFSPDGKRLVYRSDRAGNDLLQVYVADLKFDAQGVPVDIEKEHQITANEHVNWGPFWHPSGKFLVYATSEMGHSNYEIFAIEVPPIGQTMPAAQLRKRRVTFAPGADVLPVFSDDGKYMMWTTQRGPKVDGEDRPSSQVWAASFNFADAAEPGRFFANFFGPKSQDQARAAIVSVVLADCAWHRGGFTGTPSVSGLTVKRIKSGWRGSVNPWNVPDGDKVVFVLDDGSAFQASGYLPLGSQSKWMDSLLNEPLEPEQAK